MDPATPPSPSPAQPLLSSAQRRTLAAAVTLAAFIAILALVVFAVGQLARLVSLFSPLLWPLSVAAILALLLQPVVAIVETRLRVRRAVAVTALYGLFIILVTALAVILVPILVAQTLDLAARAPELWSTAVGFFQERFPDWIRSIEEKIPGQDIGELVPKWIGELRDGLVASLPSFSQVGSQVLGFFGAVAGLAIIPIYLFFFLLGSGDPVRNLGDNLPFLKPSTREDVVFLVREFVAIVVSFFRGQIVIGLCMGVILATGFTAVGLRFGLLIGLLMGVLNVVPYLGSIIGMGVALPLALFQPGGTWLTLALVLAVFVVAQCIEGWFLTPRIMGDRTGLHPVVIIVAIFFWGIALGGILGMVLAIPLTAFFVTAWRLAKRKYIRPFA